MLLFEHSPKIKTRTNTSQCTESLYLLPLVCVCVARLVNRAGPGVFSVGLCGGERPERNQLCSGGEAGGTVQTERSPALTTRPRHRLL